jgi:integrase
MDEYMLHVRPDYTTRKNNCTALRKILEAAGLKETDVIANTISAQVGLKWQKHGLTVGLPVSTINARMRQARSIFAKKSMVAYTFEEMPKAEIRTFFEAPFLTEPEQRPVLPEVDAEKKVHETLPAFPDCWRAYILGRYLGLRSKEIIAARKDWIELEQDTAGAVVGGKMWVGGREFATKSRKYRSVALPVEVIDILMASPVDCIVGRLPKETVKHTLIAKLRDCGLSMRQPLHANRRLWGSIVYTEQGPAAARDGLGHAQQATTDKHYARSLNAPKPVKFNVELARPAAPLAPVVPMVATG